MLLKGVSVLEGVDINLQNNEKIIARRSVEMFLN